MDMLKQKGNQMNENDFEEMNSTIENAGTIIVSAITLTLIYFIYEIIDNKFNFIGIINSFIG